MTYILKINSLATLRKSNLIGSAIQAKINDTSDAFWRVFLHILENFKTCKRKMQYFPQCYFSKALISKKVSKKSLLSLFMFFSNWILEGMVFIVQNVHWLRFSNLVSLTPEAFQSKWHYTKSCCHGRLSS